MRIGGRKTNFPAVKGIIMPILTVELADRCPFCGGDISFGANPAPFAVHSFPYCEQFFDLSALEFLHACNVAYGLERKENQS